MKSSTTENNTLAKNCENNETTAAMVSLIPTMVDSSATTTTTLTTTTTTTTATVATSTACTEATTSGGSITVNGTNHDRVANSKSPISISTYRETSATPSSNYQDSETTYYELCPHELRIDHSQNDDQIVIQNLCNRKNEKMSKPCQNGFCYCFTSDSDEVRFTQNKPNNIKFRHKPRKHQQQQQQQQINNQKTSNNGYVHTMNGVTGVNGMKTIPHNKISSLATRMQNISPPMPITGINSLSQDGSSIASTTTDHDNVNKNTIVKSHRIIKSNRLHSSPSIVKSRLRETFDSDPNAPIVRIIQEIHRNVVISEVRINRDKIKCSKHMIKNSAGNNTGNDASVDTDQQTDENHEILCREKIDRTIKFADKKTQTDNYRGRESDSRSSSRSGGGRLLLKRIGSDAALKLKNSQDPPRKPPRRRFSTASSHSTKFTTENSPIIATHGEKASSPINVKNLGNSPSKAGEIKNNDDDDEKFQKNPYRKLRESLPSEKEIISVVAEESQNYQKTSPSCPTFSELSSANATLISTPALIGDDNCGESKDNDSMKSSPNIGWVRPDIVNMLHYEARGNEKQFHAMKSPPEPQYQQQKQQQEQLQSQSQSQQQMGWTIPPKKDIDTVDNVILNLKRNIATVIENDFNNFASSMESKSTPVKSQILSQSNVSNRSLLKDKLLNRISHSPLRLSRRSSGAGAEDLGNNGNDIHINTLEPSKNISHKQKTDKTIKTTTFRKKATQNTKTFFENSKKKFVRFVFGSKDEVMDGQKFSTGRTIATQTFESELMSTKNPAISQANLLETTTSSKTSNEHIQDLIKVPTLKSIYPSIGMDAMRMNDSSEQQAQPQLQSQMLVSLPPSPPLTTKSPSILSTQTDNFDFTRKVNSPKIDRSIQRKLTFSPRKVFTFKNSTGLSDDKQQQQEHEQFESYKSYDSDFLNGDFRIAAMNDILASIRYKLEKNGDVIPEETLNHEQSNQTNTTAAATNTTNTTTTATNTSIVHKDLCEECNTNTVQISARVDVHNEPIYSEIEDQNHFSKKDNTKEYTHVVVSDNPNAIYAEVCKVPKSDVQSEQEGNHQHEQQQLQESHLIDNTRENCSKTTNKNKNLSEANKIVLDDFFNTYKGDFTEKDDKQKKQDHCHECYQKMSNNTEKIESDINTLPHSSNRNSYEALDYNDDVSYDEPDESAVAADILLNDKDFDQNSYYELDNVKHRIGMEEIQYYKSKLEQNNSEFRCNSCPLPHGNQYNKYNDNNLNNNNNIHKRNVESENNFSTKNHHNHNNNNNNNNNNNSNNDSLSLLSTTKYKKYRNFKERIRLSFRRSKHFLKTETRKLSNAIDKNFNRYDSKNDKLWDQSDLCISQLYASEILNEFDDNQSSSITDQIEKAVNICRQMPQFESSTELVEAERLLLYSSLKRELIDIRKLKLPSSTLFIPNSNKSRINISYIEIPIKPDGEYDMFFNYFYISVFVNGNIIKSTQSVEKRNDVAIFNDCNIIFDNLEPNFGIRAYVYVLRLRKLCNFNYTQAKRPPRKKTVNYSSDSGDEMISRFRLQGSFVIIAPNFAPYQINDNHVPYNIEKLYLNSLSTCIVPLTTLSHRTNLSNEVKITANIDLIFKKFELKGFLNVEDNNKRHNWNQKWCQLDKLKLCFWNYPQDCNNKEPELILNLIKCISYPIEMAKREICARPKAFSIQIQSDNDLTNDYDNNDKLIETYFLSTDNQKDLDYWINGLNEVIEFVRIWMC